MELKKTADIHEQRNQTAPSRHERKKDVVTTGEEYSRFFEGYDTQLGNIVKNIHEDVGAIGSDVSPTEAETFATQKAEDFSHFLDRIVTIGGETERAMAGFQHGLIPDDRDRIGQHINPLYLMMSTCYAYQQKFYKETAPDTFTQPQKDAYQLANKRMREPLFKYSLQTLTAYLENQKTRTDKEQKEDPRFQKEHAKTILQKLVEITLQTNPVDLDQCHTLLSFATNNPAAMQELAPTWHQKALYPLAERIITAGHIAAQLTQNDSPPETRGVGIADSKRVKECAALFVPLLKQDIEAATTLSAVSSWHKLDLAQINARPKGVPPPRYLRELESLAKERTNQLLQEKGLDDELLKAWQISEKPENMGEYFAKNFKVIEELEKAAPGAAQALHKEFGIHNFARQSLTFWIKQYQERDNRTTPYGVLLSPGDDWNGAFSDGHLANLVDKAVDQMGGQTLFRVIECRNKIDAVKKLLTLKQRYGVAEGGHPISFAVIAGHGSKNSIHIGQREKPPVVSDEPPPLDEIAPTNLDVITSNDIVGPGMRRLKTLFRADAPVVLISCSTGQEGGIGEVIADTHDTDLAAPLVPTHVKEWSFSATTEGKVTVKVEYRPEEKKPNISTTAIYRGKHSSEPPPL